MNLPKCRGAVSILGPGLAARSSSLYCPNLIQNQRWSVSPITACRLDAAINVVFDYEQGEYELLW